MKFVVGLSVLAMALAAGCSALPGSTSKDADEHAAHHPAGTAAAPGPAGYHQQMKRMQEMHRKIAAVKTPEERAALMEDHMRTMQDGMGMMRQMHGGMMGGKAMECGKGEMRMEPEMMKRRMDLMEMMMQMMMDRDGMKPPAGK